MRISATRLPARLKTIGDALFAGAFALAWLAGLAVGAGRPGAGDRAHLA